MNKLIKRSMELGIVSLFIGVAIVPACAQRGIKPIKPKVPKPPRTGSAGAVVHIPKVPVVPPTITYVVNSTAKVNPARNFQPLAVSLKVPHAVMRSVAQHKMSVKPTEIQHLSSSAPVLNTPDVDGQLSTPLSMKTNLYDIPDIDLRDGEGLANLPSLRNQLLRFALANRIKINHRVLWRWSNNYVHVRDYEELFPKRLTEADSPLYPVLKWWETSPLSDLEANPPLEGSQKLRLVRPNLSPIQLDPIETLLSREAVTAYLPDQANDHYYTLKKVSEMTDAIFFDQYGEDFFLDPKSAEQYPSYQDVWNEVVKLWGGSPAIVRHGLGTNPYSPLQAIFQSRNLTIQRALYDIPVEQRGLTSRYSLVDTTTQRTAEEIQFLLENLPEDNPLRQDIETMLGKNGYITPVETPVP